MKTYSPKHHFIEFQTTEFKEKSSKLPNNKNMSHIKYHKSKCLWNLKSNSGRRPWRTAFNILRETDCHPELYIRPNRHMSE
jgi:hypothetical protein